MILQHTPGRLFLCIVDCALLVSSLYVALFLRTGITPNFQYFLSFIPPFTVIIIVSIAIFYSYGLYDKPSLRLIRELSKRIFSSQIVAALGAVILFYILPVFGIAPKTILILYVIISTILMILWRNYAFSLVLRYRKQNSIIIGSGPTFHALVDELSRNPHTGIQLISTIDIDTYDMRNLALTLKATKPHSIIIDMRDERIRPFFGELYTGLFQGWTVFDIVDVYEDIFDMAPLSLINQEWVFHFVGSSRRYDGVKRLIDIILSIPLCILTCIIFPFVYVAIKMEDYGPIFFTHTRIGKYGLPFTMYTFRIIENNPHNENIEAEKITRVGAFLRKTRLSELPQVWNIIRGDTSLIGPYPEIPSLVEEYKKRVPFYNVRHAIRPGLYGWSQIQRRKAARFGIDAEHVETKLAYDLYYLKKSSFLLDIAIMRELLKQLLVKNL